MMIKFSTIFLFINATALVLFFLLFVQWHDKTVQPVVVHVQANVNSEAEKIIIELLLGLFERTEFDDDIRIRGQFEIITDDEVVKDIWDKRQYREGYIYW